MALPVHDTFHNRYVDRYLEREQRFIDQYAQEYDQIQKWHANLFTFLEARREPLILKASQAYRQVKDGAQVIEDIILMLNQLKKFFKSNSEHQTKPSLWGSTLHGQSDKHPNITLSGLVDPSMLQLASLAMGIYDGNEYSEEAINELDAILDEVKGAAIEDHHFDELFTKIDDVHNQRKLCDHRLMKYGNMIQWYQRRQHDFKSLTALRKERGGDIFHIRHKYFKSIVNLWKMHMRVCRLVNNQLSVILKANQQRQLFATRNINRITTCMVRYHTSSLHRFFQSHAQQQFAPTQAYNHAKQTGFFVNPDGGDPVQPPTPLLHLIPGNLLNPETYRQTKDDLYSPRINTINQIAQTESQQNHGHSGQQNNHASNSTYQYGAPQAPQAPSVPVDYTPKIDVSNLDAQYLDENGNLYPYVDSGYDQQYADNPFDMNPRPYSEVMSQPSLQTAHSSHQVSVVEPTSPTSMNAPQVSRRPSNARRPVPAPGQQQPHQTVSGYPAEAPLSAPGILPSFYDHKINNNNNNKKKSNSFKKQSKSALSNNYEINDIMMMRSIEHELEQLQNEEMVMEEQDNYNQQTSHDDDEKVEDQDSQQSSTLPFTTLDQLPQSLSFSTNTTPTYHNHSNDPLPNPSSVATLGLAPGTFADVAVDPHFDWVTPTPGIKVKYYPFYPHPIACNTTVTSKPVPNGVKSQFERYKFLGGVQELVMRSRRVAPPGPLPNNQTILLQTRATKKTTFNEIEGDLIYTKTHQLHFLLDKPLPGTESSSKSPRSADTDIDDGDYDKYVKTWGEPEWVIDACYVISRFSKNDVYRIIFKEHLPSTFSIDHEYKLLFKNRDEVEKWVNFVNDHNRFGPEEKTKK